MIHSNRVRNNAINHILIALLYLKKKTVLPFLNSFFNDLDVFINGVRDLVSKIDAILFPSVWMKRR